MKKVIEYVLNYRDKGKQCSILLTIDFVSNWVMREYNSIMKLSYETKEAWESILYKTAEKSSLLAEMPEGFSDKITKLENEMQVLTDKIKHIGDSDIFEKRMQIIRVILEDNNIQETFLFDDSFWDKKVDPSDIIEFLTLCAWKDIDKKKIQ